MAGRGASRSTLARPGPSGYRYGVTRQMNPRLELLCGSEQAAQATIDRLTARGLYVVRSFDLHAATAGADACGCPHHGTDRCTCAYVVLLVYGAEGFPAVLTAHSRDDRTFLEIALDPNALPGRDLVEQVLDALLADAPPAYASTPAIDAKRLLRDWPAAP